MKICKKCGKQMPIEAMFCMACGGNDLSEVAESVAGGINDYEQWSAEKIDAENEKVHTDSYYTSFLDNITLDSNIKYIVEGFVKKLIAFTKYIGGKLVQLGKIILNGIFEIITEMIPKILIGVAIGFVIGLIISGLIPFVGSYLLPFISSLCAKIGGVVGFLAYCKSKIPEFADLLENKIKIFANGGRVFA